MSFYFFPLNLGEIGRMGAGARTGGGVGRWAPAREGNIRFEKKTLLRSLTFSSEAIFVSDVGDGVDDSVRSRVAVASLHHLSLNVCAWVLQKSLLVSPDSVRRLIAAGKKCQLLFRWTGAS